MFEKFLKDTSSRFAALIVAFGVVICVVISRTEIEPGSALIEWTAWQNDGLLGIIAGITALTLLVLVALKRYRPVVFSDTNRRRFAIVVGLFMIISATSYFYTNRAWTKRHYIKFWDSYHYLIGAKYFPELGYNDFYRCHLKADRERPRPRYRGRDRIRDLQTYKVIRVRDIGPDIDCSRFTPERWREFRHDLDIYDPRNSRRVIADHGYNGTPFHAATAGRLANIPELSYETIIRLTSIDILGLCLMLGVIIWAFGWEVGVLFALFLFTNFADRFHYIGASYFRYQWLVALGIGLAFLAKKRYGVAAVFMVIAAMLNVFPLLYFAGIGIKAGHQFFVERRLERCYKDFITWGLIASMVCGAISLTHERPIENYREFFSVMGMHSRLLTHSRIGFRYNVLYRGEIDEDSPQIGYAEKQEQLQNLAIPYNILVILILIFGLRLVLRLEDVKATVFAGFLLFFMLFSTVEYYYASAAILVLFWVDDIRKRRAWAFLALLFAMMGIVYLVWNETRFIKLANNHMMSALFTVYLGALMVYLFRQQRRRRKEEDAAKAELVDAPDDPPKDDSEGGEAKESADESDSAEEDGEEADSGEEDEEEADSDEEGDAAASSESEDEAHKSGPDDEGSKNLALYLRRVVEVLPGKTRRTAVVVAILLVGLSIFYVRGRLTSSPPSAVSDDRGPRYTLMATGDTVLARRMHYALYDHDREWPLRDLIPLISSADIAMTNLETVIAWGGDLYPKGAGNPYFFRGRPELVNLLATAGFDLVTTGNNHTMDYGAEALAQQAQILDASGIAHAGAGRDLSEASRPAYIKAHDVTIAFVSMYVGTGKMAAGERHAGTFQVESESEVLEAVRGVYQEARLHADLVVFSPHWGVNMANRPTPERIRLAHDLIDLGFDAILGHSAHVLQGVEIYEGRPIVYDMGNLLSDWVSDSMQRSAIFVLEFNRRGFHRLRLVPLRLRSRRTRLSTESWAEDVMRMMGELSRVVDRGIEFQRDDGELFVDLAPPSREARELVTPPTIHATGSTRLVPERFTSKRPPTELDEPPPYAAGFTPIKLQKGVDIIGTRVVEAVATGSCFVVEVALKAQQKLTGSWEALTIVRRRGTDDEFLYPHVISNGASDARRWPTDKVIVDRICVRPQGRVSGGVHDLYYSLRARREDAKMLLPLSAEGTPLDGPAKIGSITFLDRGVNRGASGVEWDGRAP